PDSVVCGRTYPGPATLVLIELATPPTTLYFAMDMTMSHPSAELAEFTAQLEYEDIPSPVLRRIEDLLLDYVASALAGSSARAVQSIARFADTMGPTSGPSENLVTRRSTSPDRKSTRLNSSHVKISYAVFCLKKKTRD